jgi:hypothetical protein
LPGAIIMPPRRGSGTANQRLEPTAAGPSVCGCGGSFATPGFRPHSVAGGCGSAERSPTMRAERAKLKSRRVDLTIAPGKRSAARGYGRKMISSFFPSGLARQRRAKPEGKKEIGVALYPGRRPRRPCPGLLSCRLSEAQERRTGQNKFVDFVNQTGQVTTIDSNIATCGPRDLMPPPQCWCRRWLRRNSSV